MYGLYELVFKNIHACRNTKISTLKWQLHWFDQLSGHCQRALLFNGQIIFILISGVTSPWVIDHLTHCWSPASRHQRPRSIQMSVRCQTHRQPDYRIAKHGHRLDIGAEWFPPHGQVGSVTVKSTKIRNCALMQDGERLVTLQSERQQNHKWGGGDNKHLSLNLRRKITTAQTNVSRSLRLTLAVTLYTVYPFLCLLGSVTV